MKILKNQLIVLAAVLFTATITNAQTNPSTQTTKSKVMKTFVIERDIPGIGKSTAADLKGISQKSCGVIKDLGPDIVWVHSYVTGNKIYCIYKAENEEIIREHAKRGGFPANSISEVANVISPATAEQ